MKNRPLLLAFCGIALVSCEQNPSAPAGPEAGVAVAARFQAGATVPSVGWVEAKLVRPGRDSQVQIASYAVVQGTYLNFKPIALNDSFQISLTGYDSIESTRIVRWWTTQGGSARLSPTQSITLGSIDSVAAPESTLNPTSLSVGATFDLPGSWSYTTDSTDPRVSSTAKMVTESLVVTKVGTVCLAKIESMAERPVIWSDSACWNFKEFDTSMMADKAGKNYPVVRIGKQKWMASNLNWKTSNSTCYNDSSINCTKYGQLYDWNDASTACPSGWHLPTRIDWLDLLEFLGSNNSSKALKSNTGWERIYLGTNETGFNALPGGFYYSESSKPYQGIGSEANFWTGTQAETPLTAYSFYLQNTTNLITNLKANRRSVRCLAD